MCMNSQPSFVTCSYMDLDPSEKKKVKTCSDTYFYSKKCQKCKYLYVCAKLWKIEEWINI